ncbi:MAG: SIR2 family NAD-dependent protein deacylase [Gemmatimonadota bacterium]
MTSNGIVRAREILATARRIAVLTGAGVSAESGIPTFRDAQTGLWAKFDPVQLASPEGFRADPGLVWRWYAARRARVREVEPNAAHRALAAAAARFEQFTLITQNVDGLHARAGSHDVIELHGNILRSKCFGECGLTFDRPEELPPGEPPRCPRCRSLLRPDVVWFGEMLDPSALERADAAAAGADAMLVVGTSGLVYPAAGLPLAARRHGARVLIVNPDDSELDSIAEVCIRARAGEALPPLLAPD